MAVSKYVDASHNVLYSLEPDQWLEDLLISGKGDVTGYQEANGTNIRTVLKAYCASNNRVLYAPRKSDLPISWRRDVFSQIKLDGKPVQGVVEVHPSATSMGVDALMNPARDFSYVGLTHRGTGSRVLRINVHPLAGGTKRESAPDFGDSEALTEYKDWGIAQYWLDVVSFTAKQMSRPGIVNPVSRFWDVISLGGDYNAALDNTRRWYYPGAMLPALYVDDKQLPGIDHLQHAHGSDVKQGKRWVEDGHTDHRIHFVERTFTEIPDYPRDR